MCASYGIQHSRVGKLLKTESSSSKERQKFSVPQEKLEFLMLIKILSTINGILHSTTLNSMFRTHSYNLSHHNSSVMNSISNMACRWWLNRVAKTIKFSGSCLLSRRRCRRRQFFYTQQPHSIARLAGETTSFFIRIMRTAEISSFSSTHKRESMMSFGGWKTETTTFFINLLNTERKLCEKRREGKKSSLLEK